MVSLAFQDGRHRGATFMGLIDDMSDGGLCVILDGGVFERGTAVTLYLHEGLPMSAWICYSVQHQDGCRLGLSFSEVNSERAELCCKPQVSGD